MCNQTILNQQKTGYTRTEKIHIIVTVNSQCLHPTYFEKGKKTLSIKTLSLSTTFHLSTWIISHSGSLHYFIRCWGAGAESCSETCGGSTWHSNVLVAAPATRNQPAMGNYTRLSLCENNLCAPRQ